MLITTIETINGCVLIPTYNNERTLKRVLDEVLQYVPGNRLIVVNDGATDSTNEILALYNNIVILLNNDVNRGKGFSLRKGFKKASELGFDYCITMDSDGQHFASDLPIMIQTCLENPDSVLMGSRNMNQEGVPNKSSFGNKFSNFWFKVETWISLPDTQTGFRVYPLEPLKGMRLFTTKFELEIEVIVRLAWKFIPFKAVPVQVKYDPNERVSHFRPARDFFRISVLNSILVIVALLYYYPRKFFSINTLRIIRDEAIKKDESNIRKSLSLGFGVLMGIVPLWGFQLLIGIPLAVLFRLNKVLFITAANISIPPMIPFIIYCSFLVGQYLVPNPVNVENLLDFSLNGIKANSVQYVVGAFGLAGLAFLVVTIVSYLLFSVFRRNN